MDYLTCPVCNDAPLMKDGDYRTCVNFQHSITEMEYSLYSSQQMDKMNRDQDALARKELRSSRSRFGVRISKKENVTPR